MDKSEWRDEDFIAELERKLTAKTAELDRARELLNDCSDIFDLGEIFYNKNNEIKQFLAEATKEE